MSKLVYSSAPGNSKLFKFLIGTLYLVRVRGIVSFRGSEGVELVLGSWSQIIALASRYERNERLVCCSPLYEDEAKVVEIYFRI